MNKSQAASAIRILAAERKWFVDHGGCEAAYIDRYGSVDDPDHYGAGREAIYKVDREALDEAEHCGALGRAKLYG